MHNHTREELEQKSRDELIDMIMSQSGNDGSEEL
jgi:hypothetical protein